VAHARNAARYPALRLLYACSTPALRLLYACPDTGTPAQRVGTPAQRVEAAQAALQRIERTVGGIKALTARYLTEEIKHLRDAHPSYLFFEYLAPHNEAFLFSEIATDMECCGLQYVCDTDLRTLFPSTYGERTSTARWRTSRTGWSWSNGSIS
jgi:hypothetical protein